MHVVVKYPDSTKSSLEYRLHARARERWPQLTSVDVRHRANFSYVDGVLTDGTVTKLCRLRYGGSAHHWGFAIYRASHDDYAESVLPTGRHLRRGPGHRLRPLPRGPDRLELTPEGITGGTT
jgi:hypothetical protein